MQYQIVYHQKLQKIPKPLNQKLESFSLNSLRLSICTLPKASVFRLAMIYFIKECIKSPDSTSPLFCHSCRIFPQYNATTNMHMSALDIELRTLPLITVALRKELSKIGKVQEQFQVPESSGLFYPDSRVDSSIQIQEWRFVCGPCGFGGMQTSSPSYSKAQSNILSEE